MGGCAAINCTNSSRKGVRMFRFPRDPGRRKKWIINCRRDQWEPTSNSQLCVIHFEESQFESHREDNWKKLKPNAVPTIFDVPNPPQMFASSRLKGIGIPKPGTILHNIGGNLIATTSTRHENSESQSYAENTILQSRTADSTISGNISTQLDLHIAASTESLQQFSVSNSTNELVVELQKRVALLTTENFQKQEIIDEKQRQITELQKRVAYLEKEHKTLLKHEVEKDNSLSFLSEEQVIMARTERKCIHNWSHEGVIKGLKLRFALGKYGYNFLRATGYPTPSYSTLNRRIQNVTLNIGVIESIRTLLKSKVEVMDPADRICSLMADEMEISTDPDFDTTNYSFVGNVTLGNKSVPGNHYLVLLLRGLKNPWKQVIAHHVTSTCTSGPDMKTFVNSAIAAATSVWLNIKAFTSDMGSNNKALWNSLGVAVTRSERNTSFVSDNSPEIIYAIADVPHLLKNIRSAFLRGILLLAQDTRDQENLPSHAISSDYIKSLWKKELESDKTLRSLHHLHKRHLFPTHFSTMDVTPAVQLFSIKTAAALEKAVHLKQLDSNALTTAWFIRLIAEWFNIMTARHSKKSITLRNKEQKFQFLRKVIDVFQYMECGKGWKPIQTGVILSTLSIMELSQYLFSKGYKFFMPGRVSQDALENIFSQVRRKAGSKPTALQAQRAMKMICVSQFLSDLTNTNYTADSDSHLLDYSHMQLHEDSETTPPTLTGAPIQLTVPDKNDIFYIAGATVNALRKRILCNVCMALLQSAEDPNTPIVPQQVTLLTQYCDLGGLSRPSSGIYKICEESEKILQCYKEQLLSCNVKIDNKLIDEVKMKCSDINLPECCKIKEKIITHYLTARCKGITRYISDKNVQSAFGSASAYKKQRKV